MNKKCGWCNIELTEDNTFFYEAEHGYCDCCEEKNTTEEYIVKFKTSANYLFNSDIDVKALLEEVMANPKIFSDDGELN